MTLSLQEVEHIARLARLALSDEEKARFAAQLSSILEYAARLQSVDTGEIPESSNDLPGDPELAGRLRDDEPQPGLEIEPLLDNAPQTHDRQFRMPPVFE